MAYPLQISYPRPFYWIVLTFPRGCDRKPVIVPHPQMDDLVPIYVRQTITHGTETFKQTRCSGSVVTYLLKESK